jgi:hypothetical protein
MLKRSLLVDTNSNACAVDMKWYTFLFQVGVFIIKNLLNTPLVFLFILLRTKPFQSHKTDSLGCGNYYIRPSLLFTTFMSFLSYKGSIFGWTCSSIRKCVRLTKCGLQSPAVTAVCLPGHTQALYRPPDRSNRGPQREVA